MEICKENESIILLFTTLINKLDSSFFFKLIFMIWS